MEVRRKANHDVIVEGTRGEGDLLRLLIERIDDLGVAVALIDRRIGREKVQIPEGPEASCMSQTSTLQSSNDATAQGPRTRQEGKERYLRPSTSQT